MTKPRWNRFGVVENAGPNTLKALISAEATRSSAVDIGVAFVTSGGLDHVLPRLKKAAARGRVRILTGLYQCFTEPEALRRLLRVQSQLKDRFQSRISTDERFHWKSYFLFTASNVTLCVGSSNLTSEGLRSSGEINLTVSLPTTSSLFKAVHAVFEAEWERAKPLTSEIVARYVKARPSHAGANTHPRVPLAKILGSPPEPPPGTNGNRVTAFHRDAITGFADSDTESAIGEETDWDEKGYWWYSTGRPAYHEGDRIVLFDLPSGYVELVEVVRTTRMTRSTPDGRYFAAYRRVKGTHRRKLNRHKWADLRRGGWIKNRGDAAAGRKLTEGRFEQLVEALRLS